MQLSVVKNDFLAIKVELFGILKVLENLLQWSGLLNGFWKILRIQEFLSLQIEKNWMIK